LGNVYDQLKFLSNSASSVAGQKIDNAGNKTSLKPTIFATAFDIEYAFGRIYMSVTLPSADQSCTTLSLYSFTPPNSSRNMISDSTLLFSTPCVLDKKNPTMWGGRITHSSSNLYLSVGEQRYDPSGFPKKDKLSTSEIAKVDSVFGKVLEFEPGGSTYSIYSSGHRNAQGLYFSKDDMGLIESEHGPFGGDEVNVLVKGNNYGWPLGTFGKPYPLFNTGHKEDEVRSLNPATTIDKQLAEFGAISGSQPGAHLPIMSWAPGVGAGNITKIQKSSGFVDWRGNIVVSLMADMSLHRLILSGNSVIFDENISLGFRVRDFIVNDLGFLILSTDQGRLLIYRTTSSEM
jgi:glucose/arabinose dehydrogenase